MVPQIYEKESNTIFKNPYTYDSNLKLRLITRQIQGISPGRLSEFLKKGYLSGRTERVIQFLYESQFLTGHLIQCCFHHPRILLEHKKIRNDAKNPYLSEIKFLIRIGAISQYGYFNHLQIMKSGYIYSLTNGCRNWAKERFEGEYLFSHHPILTYHHSRKGESQNPGLIWMQNLLSLNQFHITMTVNHWRILTDIKISNNDFPYAFYTINDSISICAVSIRNCTEIPAAFLREIPVAFLSENKHINEKAFIVIAESIVMAAKIMCLLKRLEWPYWDSLLFTTDFSTKDSKNPLNDELVRFVNPSYNEYEICSLRI